MKITRSRFFASTALVLGGVTFGCGGNYGGTPDSVLKGTYPSTYSIPGSSEVGNFNYSVDQKGNLSGYLSDVSTSKTMAVNAVVNNKGTFSGQVVDGNNKYPISGTITDKGGNFSITQNGTEQRGSFTVGGTISTEGTSAYQGIYAGIYSIPGLNQGGLTSYTVDSKGNITGSIQKGSETGLFTGTVSSTGSFTATAKFSTVSQALQGTIVKTADGSSQGNFTVTQGGQTYPATFSKSETAQAGQSSIYNGSYRGTYGLPERNESGTVSFTIDPSGSIQGYFSQTANQPVATFTGTIQNDGGFTGALTYATNSPAPYNAARAIVGKIGDVQNPNTSGTKKAGDFTVTIGGVNVPGSMEITIDGSEPNSKFLGSYGESNIVSGITVDNGYALGSTGINFTTDVQGHFVGTLAGRSFTGVITNDGRFSGVWGGMQVNGIIAHQGIDVLVDGKTVSKPGIAGNFAFTQGGVTYTATIAGVGGN